jgi:hypothetical protein
MGHFYLFVWKWYLGKTFPIKSKKIFRKLFTIRVKGYPLPFTGWFIKNVNVCKKRWKLILISLQACFDLTSGSSLSMKIQIIGGKITENLRFKSPLRKVKTWLFFFLFISNSSHKSVSGSFILTTLLYLVWLIRNQIKHVENLCFYW